MTTRVLKLTDTAHTPTRAKDEDAGWDMYADGRTVTVGPGERILVSTGCAYAIPSGYYGRIADRSGKAYKEGLHVLGGVIDSGYRGEVKVLLLNTSNTKVSIFRHDRIAQLIITKISEGDMVEVLHLEETVRGEDGFGSTGR